jgi:hypothetical protein
MASRSALLILGLCLLANGISGRWVIDAHAMRDGRRSSSVALPLTCEPLSVIIFALRCIARETACTIWCLESGPHSLLVS